MMPQKIGAALNHMTVPGFGTAAFLDLAASLGCDGVEFRNDLGRPLFEGLSAESVAAMARSRNLRILGLSEVKRFNDWSDEKAAEARALCEIAVALGAESVSLIPRNDGGGLGNGERQANLRLALRELAPILAGHGLTGLVEPLGFEGCALRSKAEAVEAIEGLGATGRFKLVHDTFHHHIAGGGPVFAAHTGIIHVSGVTVPALAPAEMRDADRGLVDTDDRLGNVAQIARLVEAGYRGPVSVEAFSPRTHALTNPEAALAASFAFIASALTAPAA